MIVSTHCLFDGCCFFVSCVCLTGRLFDYLFVSYFDSFFAWFVCRLPDDAAEGGCGCSSSVCLFVSLFVCLIVLFVCLFRPFALCFLRAVLKGAV